MSVAVDLATASLNMSTRTIINLHSLNPNLNSLNLNLTQPKLTLFKLVLTNYRQSFNIEYTVTIAIGNTYP
jgi:hypothetical protein